MGQKKVNAGIIELDIHGMTEYQARICIDSNLKKTDKSIYRIRIIHGFHNGTVLKDMVKHGYAGHTRVLRIESGLNEGITDLVLREL